METNHVSDFIANFNPESYLALATLGKECPPDEKELLTNLATLYHEIFSTHEPGDKKLLDMGSGPCVWQVISASAKYKNITLSDPVEANRRVLKQYMNDTSEDQRWMQNFKLIAQLEGDEKVTPEIQDRLRNSIKQVIWCDVVQEKPLGTEQPIELYDCVTASLCLGNACEDASSYIKAMKNLASLAKPGAPIVVGGVLGSSCYRVGKTKFSVQQLTAEMVQECVKKAGCKVMKFKVINLTIPAPYSKRNAVYVVEACQL